MILNEGEFSARLQLLGDLYEEGKDCLNDLTGIKKGEMESYLRLFVILRELRDMSVVQLQRLHMNPEN